MEDLGAISSVVCDCGPAGSGSVSTVQVPGSVGIYGMQTWEWHEELASHLLQSSRESSKESKWTKTGWVLRGEGKPFFKKIPLSSPSPSTRKKQHRA